MKQQTLPDSSSLLSLFLRADKLTEKTASYPELHNFKRELKSTPIQQPLSVPYTLQKRRVHIYQMIFIFLGIFFFTLAYTIMNGSVHAVFLQHVQQLVWGKSFLSLICTTFGLIGFGITATLRPEEEVIRHIRFNSQRKLSRLYQGKKAHFQIAHHYWPWGKHYPDHLEVYLEYSHACEALNYQTEEAFSLVRHIAKSHTLSRSSRETLFNQALTEYRRKIEALTENFNR